MQVFVYRSSKKAGLYVYVLNEEQLSELPPPLLKQLGEPEHALTFELTADRKLGSENPTEVRANLESEGFHVQMPRDIEDIVAEISKNASAKK